MPVTVALLVVAVLAFVVVLAAIGLSTEAVIALASTAVLTASELVRQLVAAVAAGRRRG
ncbi:hypothetical protein PUR61_05395 [Streptomyces sp. BE20]|uniref:hypothetical protein n=1 Tax=Streptomyces sp. BE20 TaxID=3002525 RepID=UPI002E79E32E|nr:hypothetical protein [Streptomyces sp. BE20]MEE1821633.1 hypothetical protein [Streptomyces sp. BE20]